MAQSRPPLMNSFFLFFCLVLPLIPTSKYILFYWQIKPQSNSLLTKQKFGKMAIGNGTTTRILPFSCFLYCYYCFILVFFLVEFSHGQSTQTNNVLTQGQKLSIGSQLISSTANFMLGFYNPYNSNTTYLGISYNTNHQKPIWIANPNSPFPSNSTPISLTIDANGSFKIQNGYYSFSLFDVGQPTTSSAILQDDGNFVLRELNRDGSVKQILWQSFDHPTDTLLPGMKIGINHKTNSTWSLTSWRTIESPMAGAFTLAMNPNNTYQLLIFFRGALFWSSGNWKDGSFEFLQYLSNSDPYNSNQNQEMYINRISNENETFFIYYIPKFDRSPTPYALYYPKSGEFVLPQLRLEDGGNLGINDQSSYSVCSLFENEDGGCVWKEQQKIPECRNWLYGFSEPFSPRFGYMEEGINGSNYNKQSGNLTMFECETICIFDCDCIAIGFSDEEDGTSCEIWKSGATFNSVSAGSREYFFLDHTTQTGQGYVFILCFVIYKKKK